MKNKFIELTFLQRGYFLFLTIYIVLNSLFINGSVGYLSILLVILYFIIFLSAKYNYKISLMLSFILISLASVLNLLDMSSVLDNQISKLSQWVFMLMFISVPQILLNEFFVKN
jgi:hypothetical protein